MAAGTWYTLIRFHRDPQHLTGVAQARTAQETLALLEQWETRYPADTAVVFDPRNRPLERDLLAQLAQGVFPPSRQAPRGA